VNSRASVQCSIRPARPEDVPTILGFVQALAEFERLSHQVTAAESTFALSLFGPRAYAECLLAFVEESPAGFALFFHNFSTFNGKPGLYLEDIYVEPAYRSHGIGLSLFRELAKIALARDCQRFEWSVLDWNEKAIAFYRRLGAEPMSEWTVQRLTREKIEELAKG
jgi:GNAT superfamily N-acetyltransferase